EFLMNGTIGGNDFTSKHIIFTCTEIRNPTSGLFDNHYSTCHIIWMKPMLKVTINPTRGYITQIYRSTPQSPKALGTFNQGFQHIQITVNLIQSIIRKAGSNQA